MPGQWEKSPTNLFESPAISPYMRIEAKNIATRNRHILEKRVGEDGSENRARGMLRCLGRLALTAPVALASLFLALGDPAPVIVTVAVVGLWLWLAGSVVAGIVQTAKAVEAAASEPSANINPFYFMYRIPRICAWTSLLLLAAATGALFAAGEPALATTMEIFLIIRLAMSLAPDSEFMPEKKDTCERGYIPVISAVGAFGIFVIACAAWLALWSPPGWAENMILTWFWIVAVGLITVQCMLAFGFTIRPWLDGHHNGSRRQKGVSPDMTSRPPEPLMTPGQQFNIWLWRVSWIVVTWALWTAGQPLLAGLYLLGRMLKLAVGVRVRRQKHGDTARIDFLARAVHLLLWWPLVITATAVGTMIISALIIPLGILSAIYDRIVGAPPPPAPDAERDALVRQARIRRAAASYRLREAFGKPEGFTYFMCSEPHQREHFLGPGGLLAGLGDPVIARDYRTNVLETRTTHNWRAFEQSPEGALLHVNGVSNMRRDLPFIAIVPPRGRVQVFGLSEPYRARTRDKGAALEQVEAEFRAAIEATFGPGAGEAESC